MNKELEEYKYSNLELLREIWFNVPEGSQKAHQKHFDLILSKLNELQAIKEANPSEALNYLNQFINEMTYCLEHQKEFAKGYEKQIFWKYKNTFETTIKQALLKAQEQEKRLSN